jgi:hypothetical protein
LEAFLYKYTEASNGWEIQGEFRKKLILEKDKLGIYELDGSVLIAEVYVVVPVFGLFPYSDA